MNVKCKSSKIIQVRCHSTSSLPHSPPLNTTIPPIDMYSDQFRYWAQQSTASRAHSSHTLSPSRRANNPPPFCALPLLLVSRSPAPYDLIDRQPVVIANMLVGGSLGSSLQRVPHCRGVTPRCICRASPLCTTRARNGWTRQRRNERLRPMSAVTPSSPVPYPTR